MGIETSSDRDFVCFVCGEWTSKAIGDECPKCKFNLAGAVELQNSKIDTYTLERYVGRGYYGATFQAVNRIGKRFALKLSPIRLYAAQGKDFEAEILRYRSIGHHPNIAELIDAGTADVILANIPVSCHYVVMEWIEGVELSKFAEETSFSLADMFSIVRGIISAVVRLEKANLWHNDLNANNILIAVVTEDEFKSQNLDTRYLAKIVDFGSAVFRQQEKHKALDDIKFTARHINKLRTVLLARNDEMSKEDRFFLMEVEKIIARALDEDPTRAITSAIGLAEQLSTLYKSRPLLHEQSAVSLQDPFSYLNANDFPNDRYVNLLFSGEFPWLKSIMTPEPQSFLITGPRGCGKTMLLKSLRLKTRLTQRAEQETASQIAERIERDRIIGFFVSARISIGNHCPLTKLPQWALQEEMVSALFNLLWAFEVADSLALMSAKAIADIGTSAEREVTEFIATSFGIPSVTTWQNLTSELVKKQREIIEGGYAHGIPQSAVGPAFLTDLCQLLKLTIAPFSGKNVVFLLDDFSLPRVPREIQEVLLSSIWNSGGGYSFRVSAHSESVVLRDRKGVTYLPNREFTEINLGSLYVGNLDEGNRLDSIKSSVDDILKRRFALSDKYRNFSLERALGEARPSDVAGEIRTRAIEKKLQGLKYAGWETIIRLCSGDISYIIDVLRTILLDQSSNRLVGVNAQNKAIRNYARQQLYRLKDYSDPTCDLYEVALNFGKFSKFKLVGKLIGAEQRPAEYLRIEVETDRLSPRARDALSDLLRNGVFVDGGFSSSSQGTPARRLILKKLFTPVFPTTYNSRDTWPMTSAHFEKFVTDPEGFLKGILSEDGVTPEEQSRQMDMLIDPVLE